MTRALCLLAVALMLPDFAAAQLRTLPEVAERGRIEHVVELVVRVDGRDFMLAPGATIRSERNLTIVPSALPRGGETLAADYIVDASGQISRVWLLTPEEAARPRKKAASQ
jgi:hypothetical protein